MIKHGNKFILFCYVIFEGIKFVFLQAAGAVGGAIAISEVMPSQYKHMLGGPSVKVDLHTAAMAEGVLTFLISLAVLVIIVRIPGGILVKTWLLAMATVTLVIAGSTYTGPSMNPANVSISLLGSFFFLQKILNSRISQPDPSPFIS